MDWDAMILVGRIARPHGIRGQVAVNPETDFVEHRFRPDAVFWTRSGAGDEQLTVSSVRLQNGRPIVGFEGVTTIDAAERLAGLELRVPENALAPLETGVYYHHQLIGCVVHTGGGARIGDVVRVDGGSAGSLLVVNGARGEVLIPLVTDICVDIDVAARRIAIEPPEGLLELNETDREIRHRHDLPAHGAGRPGGGRGGAGDRTRAARRRRARPAGRDDGSPPDGG